jgi:hypothetical protein
VSWIPPKRHQAQPTYLIIQSRHCPVNRFFPNPSKTRRPLQQALFVP